MAMDLAQLLVVDLGWFFFAAWSTVVAALAVVAFGSDILAFAHHSGGEKERQ
jgi:hypothetical protein